MAGDGLFHEAAELGTLFFTADEGRALGEDRGGGGCCLLLPRNFVQPPALREAFQPEAAAVREADISHRPNERLYRFGNQNLSGLAFRLDIFGRVYSGPEEVTGFFGRLPGIDPDPHQYLFCRATAVPPGEPSLNGDRALDGFAGGGEGDHEAVADGFHLAAAVRPDLLADDRVVFPEGTFCVAVTEAVSQRGVADDIGEHHRDGG